MDRYQEYPAAQDQGQEEVKSGGGEEETEERAEKEKENEQERIDGEEVDETGEVEIEGGDDPAQIEPIHSPNGHHETGQLQSPDYDISGEGGAQPYSSQLSKGQQNVEVEDSVYQEAQYDYNLQEEWGDSEVEFNTYGDPPVFDAHGSPAEVDFVGEDEPNFEEQEQRSQATERIEASQASRQRPEQSSSSERKRSGEIDQIQVEHVPLQQEEPVVENTPTTVQKGGETIIVTSTSRDPIDGGDGDNKIVQQQKQSKTISSQPKKTQEIKESRMQPQREIRVVQRKEVVTQVIQREEPQEEERPKKTKTKKKTKKTKNEEKKQAVQKPAVKEEQKAGPFNKSQAGISGNHSQNTNRKSVAIARLAPTQTEPQKIQPQQEQPSTTEGINYSGVRQSSRQQDLTPAEQQSIAASTSQQFGTRVSEVKEQPLPRGENQPEGESHSSGEPKKVAVAGRVPPPPPQDLPPPLTSLIILHQAQKERIESTYQLFLKYNSNHAITSTRYKNILNVVCCELAKKKSQKNSLKKALMDYLEDLSKECREFSAKCNVLQPPPITNAKNKHANIGLECRAGLEGLYGSRRVIANQMGRVAGFIQTSVIASINRHFDLYMGGIAIEQAKLYQRRQEYWDKFQRYNKLIKKLDKNFRRGIQGKKHDDLLAELCKMVNEQIVQRRGLIELGNALVTLRKAHVRCERQLFSQLQLTLNQLKTESTAAYCQLSRRFDLVLDCIDEIKNRLRFEDLALLTDIDYIKYVLELHYKEGHDQFRNKHFQDFLRMVYFDTVVGDIRILYKGPTVKIFPLANPNESLVHTTSGNLVLFASERDECRDKFVLKNLSTRLTGKGGVDFQEVLPGVIFDDKRTVRLALLEDDRAQELVFYLNEKESQRVVEGP